MACDDDIAGHGTNKFRQMLAMMPTAAMATCVTASTVKAATAVISTGIAATHVLPAKTALM